VKEVLNYFNKQHSTINITALDISKAFDKVNHFILFDKLLDRSVPVCLVKVLVCWYDKCSAVVRWSNAMSRVFHICAGVCQGGILSPLLFAVYIDGLVQNVESSGFGCWLHGLFVDCILYADNIILLAQTTFAVLKMLDICMSEITALDLYFNVSKSVVMRNNPLE